MEKAGTKPSIGKKLNKLAIITLFNVNTKFDEQKAEAHMRRHVSKMPDARFMRYDLQRQQLVFEVQHFTKFGLGDDTDDEEMQTEQ